MAWTPETKREVARKILHMSMGLFALCLRWLTPWQAALCALAALLHNLYLFPHYGMKRLERPEEKARGYSGMVGYPAVVLVLMVLSADFIRYLPWGSNGIVWDPGSGMRESLAAAAGAWAILAFGDSFGALAGILLKGPQLPWNAKKTWSGLLAFLLFGTLFAFIWMRFVRGESISPTEIWIVDWHSSRNEVINLLGWCALAAFVAGIVETLPGQIDDNLTVPLAAWSILLFHQGWISHGLKLMPALMGSESWAGGRATVLGLLGINLGLAFLAFVKRWVDWAGFLLGLSVGIVVILALGWRGYLLLTLFYMVANGSTYFGKRLKEQRGIAEAHGGQRRTESVFSKGFVPAVFAIISAPAFAASLAVYAADTAASEFGKTSKGRTFSLLRRSPAAPGTVGAVSLRGTAAGLVVLAIFSVLYRALFILSGPSGCGAFYYRWGEPYSGFERIVIDLDRATLGWFVPLTVLIGAAIWFFLESAINEWNERRRAFSKVVIHVMVGIGAGIAAILPQGFVAYWLYRWMVP